MTIYKGFSTIGQLKRFDLTDFNLVVRDLLNNFNIRKGEKLMNPNYGTIIWNLLFENFTDDVKSAIVQDIQTIAANDPRLQLNNVVVTSYQKGIQLTVTVTYLPTNQSANMLLTFLQTNQQLTASITPVGNTNLAYN
jgi:phage baseplate assembly protein W